MRGVAAEFLGVRKAVKMSAVEAELDELGIYVIEKIPIFWTGVFRPMRHHAGEFRSRGFFCAQS